MQLDPESIPAHFEVQPIDPDDSSAIAPATCGTCGLTWDDGKITSWTPAPSGRCPFEPFHKDAEAAPDDRPRFWVAADPAADDPLLPAAEAAQGGAGPHVLPIIDETYGGVIAWANTDEQAARIVRALELDERHTPRVVAARRTQHAVLVSLIVKDDTREQAEDDVTFRLNAWLQAPPNAAPYPNGTLLSWTFYEPKVVNGR